LKERELSLIEGSGKQHDSSDDSASKRYDMAAARDVVWPKRKSPRGGLIHSTPQLTKIPNDRDSAVNPANDLIDHDENHPESRLASKQLKQNAIH
jgi:hypothetical protein